MRNMKPGLPVPHSMWSRSMKQTPPNIRFSVTPPRSARARRRREASSSLGAMPSRPAAGNGKGNQRAHDQVLHQRKRRFDEHEAGHGRHAVLGGNDQDEK